MFKDEGLQFILYVLAIGILIILAFCIMQVFILGRDVPFINGLGWGRNKPTGEFVYNDPPSLTLDEAKNYQANFQTNLGNFKIELFEENAPNTVNNFLFLARNGYYNDVKVHRVLKDMLFQTGDRNTLTDNEATYGSGNPGYVFDDEINWESINVSASQIQALTEQEYSSTPDIISKPLQRYSVAMANSGPNTNGSQFFVVTAVNTDTELSNLNGKHTVFGKVIEGYETIEDINNAPVDISNKNAPLPFKDIIIEKIDIIELTK